MSLVSGSRLGAYEIVAAIGSGGMGEVYRAHDTKLNRDVAIKILPDAFTLDPERLARFKREAQVLASLNHPNIAAIYGFEDSDGVHALVLELVDGPTLADLVAAKPLSIDESLGIARQIAEALETAHGQNIVHRDLKPANIKVRGDGVVKVLDFGLAKATVDDAAAASSGAVAVTNSPTITTPTMMTAVGVILGTAAYMSPEQAKGRQADKRSDIWSFGCVLYEMLTGRRAFEGDDVSDTLAAVLRGQPEWAALPAALPETVRLMLQRCLEKDRSKRISDISTVRFVLTEPALASEARATRTAAARTPWWTKATAIVGAAALGAVLFGLSVRRFGSAPANPIVTRFTYRLPEGQRFTNAGRRQIALSPDGTRTVYVANQRLYIRAMWEAEATPLVGVQNGGLTSPVFSPDGQWIAYWAAPRNLNKIAITGGAPIKLAEVENPFGMSWAGGSLFVGSPKGVLRVPEKGGDAEVVIAIESDQIAHGPQLLSDGKSVLFTLAEGVTPDRWDRAQIVVQAVGSKERKTLIRGGSDAQYLDAGYLVYALGGTLFAEPFDVVRLQAVGEPRSIVDGVARANGTTGSAHLVVSHSGALMYVPGPTTAGLSGSEVALFDRHGTLERLKLDPHTYASPRFSPNGQQLALGIDDPPDSNIWVYDLSGNHAIRQLTFGGNNRFPIWTHDGRRIAFQSDREGNQGIFWQPADGNGSAERLTKAEQGESQIPDGWSPDGETLLFTSRAGARQFVLRMLTMHDRKVGSFGDVQSNAELGAAFSPDGRAVVYALALDSGQSIWMRPFPLTDVKYRVGQGINPFWASDGKSIYFVTAPGASAFSNLNVTIFPTFAAGQQTAVPRPTISGGGPNVPRAYDVAPNNQQFVAFVGTSEVADPQIDFVLNWIEELKRLVPAK